MNEKRLQNLIDAQHLGDMKGRLLQALEMFEAEPENAKELIMFVIKTINQDEVSIIDKI
jgi:hypothetical protein